MKYQMPDVLPPSFLKWYAVASLASSYEEIAYLDTDTMVFDDVAKLFEQPGSDRFYA